MMQSLEDKVYSLIQDKGGRREKTVCLYQTAKYLAGNMAETKEEIGNCPKQIEVLQQKVEQLRDMIIEHLTPSMSNRICTIEAIYRFTDVAYRELTRRQTTTTKRKL